MQVGVKTARYWFCLYPGNVASAPLALPAGNRLLKRARPLNPIWSLQRA
jgi:hypothetical protein